MTTPHRRDRLGICQNCGSGVTAIDLVDGALPRRRTGGAVMKALTVRQPWAWAIIHGGKDVENRSRNIARAYRGPLAIHAGVSIEDLYDVHDARVAEALRSAQTSDRPTVGDHLDFGAIIGVADLVDVHRNYVRALDNVCFDNHTPIGKKCSSWAEQFDRPGGFHLVLANPCPCEPIPCRGALGLWTVPADIETRIAREVGSDG